MDISTHLLEAMGYKALGEGEVVEGHFTRIEVFAVQGFKLDAPCLPPAEDRIRGVPFKLGFGTSLNEVCKILGGDIYVDDEEQWKKETRSAPPFLVLAFGPTDQYVGLGSHFKEDQDVILTYDSFNEAKEELKRQVDTVVPTLLTALSLTFSNEGRLVHFLPRDTAVVGKSADGRAIYDMRLTVSAEGFVSSKLNEGDISASTSLSLNRAKLLDPKIANFYYLGSNEADPLKRFLYFFLFVERLVHLAFAEINSQVAISTPLSGYPHVERFGKKLLEENRKDWKNLLDRFIWCVMHKWTHLTDSDVVKFKQLKGIRDKISHGVLSAPDGAAVISIEVLAQRIQRDS